MKSQSKRYKVGDELKFFIPRQDSDDGAVGIYYGIVKCLMPTGYVVNTSTRHRNIRVNIEISEDAVIEKIEYKKKSHLRLVK